MPETIDLAIVGAGAAGLMAAIWARRAGRCRSIAVLDGARSLGAKILVAGGGRCNVTHHHVDESAYAGSSRNAIKKVLRRFDVERTVAFFREMGVELKREETGKLFPATDSARTVLNALLNAARDPAADPHPPAAILHPRRVERIERDERGFLLTGPPDGWGSLHARRLVLATGGMSLPKTGSDGHGYRLARSLGHTTTARIFPALVPLTLADGSFIRALSGLSVETTLTARSSTGRRLISFTGSTLCTHFGLSGPCPLDVSRYYLDAAADDPETALVANWLPGETAESVDRALIGLARATPGRFLAQRLPERLARAVCEEAGVDPALPGHQLTRERRRALAAALTEMPLPVTGTRGFTHAEVTAGGVPLSELHLDTMESRLCPGLHLCGEICDVDGRIGGFNFQWAWASGYTAGVSVDPGAALNDDASAAARGAAS